MNLGLEGKTALVLASSKGLGRATAIALAQEGSNVIVTGRDVDALNEVEQIIENETSGSVLTVVGDLTNENDRKTLVQSARERFGAIDILVTNTGGPAAGTFEQFQSDDWRSFFELLFVSVTDIINQVLPDMKAKKAGRILMISSVTLKQPVDNLIASNAVRTSILGLMKSLANELGRHGITVNTLMPGFTLTNRLKNLINQNKDVNNVKSTIPLRRFGAPEEFGETAAFFCSERASYITGAAIPVDGGWVKGY